MVGQFLHFSDPAAAAWVRKVGGQTAANFRLQNQYYQGHLLFGFSYCMRTKQIGSLLMQYVCLHKEIAFKMNSVQLCSAQSSQIF